MKTASSFCTLTAADLMSREVITLRENDPLDRAAKLFAKEQIGGAPVVDCEGCCVGVLSLADLVRWAEQKGSVTVVRATPEPRTCSFQTTHRDRFGKEMILCTLSRSICPFQQEGTSPAGTAANVCGQPNCVPTDWQVVEVIDSVPSTVRDFMTTDVVLAHPYDHVLDIAQNMIDAQIHRVVVVDRDNRPVGVVSTTDCLAAMVRESRFAKAAAGAGSD